MATPRTPYAEKEKVDVEETSGIQRQIKRANNFLHLRSNLKALQIPGRKKDILCVNVLHRLFYPPGNSEIS